MVENFVALRPIVLAAGWKRVMQIANLLLGAGGPVVQRRVEVDLRSERGEKSFPLLDLADVLQMIRSFVSSTNAAILACASPKKGPLLKCAAKVDVIILLDGSGSLGKKGWDVMKKAGESLVTAMDPKANGGNGAQVAVLLYSGPKNMDAYKRCTGEVPKGGRKPDLAMDCKMIWVSHFTTSNDAVAENIGNLYWQKGSTMTSQALASAEAELVYGRPDAQQVVIALTDRMPMMPRKTGEAATSLRKKARLIWAAAAGPSELSKFASWASRPVADNLVAIKTLDDFAKPEMLNKIIAAACPEVE